jgi:hypothetical protein
MISVVPYRSTSCILLVAASAALLACGSETDDAASNATGGASPGTGGSGLASAGFPTATGGAASVATGGANTGSGGVSTGGTAAGGAVTGKGGASSGAGAGGAGASAGANATGGGPQAGASSACQVGAWPTADPAEPGPFTTVTESEVGPEAGEAEDGEPAPRFTLFRPTELGRTGLCHPVFTWGNGTGTSPSLYRSLLTRLASHGIVVIASNSPNVASGDPPPMVAGVTWVIEQNADPASPMYQRIDTTHVGASGHSQGGFATTQAGANEHITTIAPIAGARTQRNLHGPALLICGGMDSTVPCSGIEDTFDGITNQPVMLANSLADGHSSWVSRSGQLSNVELAVVAWMRVHLLADTELRPWFYGASCKLCTDANWQVLQKDLDQ